MAEYLVQDTSLTAVADAIRAKTASSDMLVFPEGFISAITSISDVTVSYREFDIVPSQAIRWTAGDSQTTFNQGGEYYIPFVLVEGETYTVEWNGVSYVCVAYDTGVDGIIAISSDGRFQITYQPSGTSIGAVYIKRIGDTSSTISGLRIYQTIPVVTNYNDEEALPDVVIFDGTVTLKPFNEEVVLSEPIDLDKKYSMVFNGVEYSPLTPYMDEDNMLHLGAWDDYSTIPIGICVGDLEDPTYAAAAWDTTSSYDRNTYPLTITCIG